MIERHEIDADLINSTPLDVEGQNNKFSAELKWANTFIRFVQDHNCETKTVKAVYALPNHLNSVGSNVEKFLALMGDVPTYEVFLNEASKDTTSDYYGVIFHMLQDIANDSENHLEMSVDIFRAIKDAGENYGLFYIKPFHWQDFGRRDELPHPIKEALRIT